MERVVFLRTTTLCEKLPPDDGLSVETSGLTGIVSYHRGRIEAEEVRVMDLGSGVSRGDAPATPPLAAAAAARSAGCPKSNH